MNFAFFAIGFVFGVAGMAAFVWHLIKKNKSCSDELNRCRSEAEDLRIRTEQEKHALSLESVRIQTQFDSFRQQKESERDFLKNAQAQQEKSWQEKFAFLKSEFKNLANAALTEKSEALKALNGEQLSTILTPFQEKLNEFKKTVSDTHTDEIKLNSELRKQLEMMANATQKLGTDAQNLADALKGNSKIQGDWGEMILSDLLQRSGLKQGEHYELQPTLRDEDGNLLRNDDTDRMMRPDAIIHYPDKRDVVLDSKVSLTAYLEYVNAEDETVRKEALKKHVTSVKNHVSELSDKNYAAHMKKADHETFSLVIMFIPNEPSYQLAMMEEPGLWHNAFEKNILIVSPINLLTLLQLIQLAWIRSDQERNQKKILETAARLLDRIQNFYTSFDGIGGALEKVSKTYQEAVDQLKGGGGKHSVIKAVDKLVELGVRAKKEFRTPKRLQTDDMLEIESGEAESDSESEPEKSV